MERRLTKLINSYGTIEKVPERLLLSFKHKDLSKLPNQFKKIVQSTIKNLLIDVETPSKKQKKSRTMSLNRECANKQDDNCQFYLQDKNHMYLTESQKIAQDEYNKLEELTRQREVAREKYWKKREKEEREREFKNHLFRMYLERERKEMEYRERMYERHKNCLEKNYKERSELLSKQATLSHTLEDIESQISVCNYNIRNNPLYAYY
jgi:hypothetical protein